MSRPDAGDVEHGDQGEMTGGGNPGHEALIHPPPLLMTGPGPSHIMPGVSGLMTTVPGQL